MRKKVLKLTPKKRKYIRVFCRDNETKLFTNAVENAIAHNQAQGHPIARYDISKRKAYMEYPDGRRVYAES